MAATLTLSGNMQFVDGLQTLRLGGSVTVSVGTHSIQNEGDIGAVEETLAKGDIGTIGWAGFQIEDTDTTHYVDIGTSTGVYSWRVYGNAAGGQFQGPIYVNATTLYAKSSTGTIKLSYQLHETV